MWSETIEYRGGFISQLTIERTEDGGMDDYVVPAGIFHNSRGRLRIPFVLRNILSLVIRTRLFTCKILLSIIKMIFEKHTLQKMSPHDELNAHVYLNIVSPHSDSTRPFDLQGSERQIQQNSEHKSEFKSQISSNLCYWSHIPDLIHGRHHECEREHKGSKSY